MAEIKNGPILLSIAVLGGTGREGSGLARRWALNGYRVIIGSRDAEKAIRRAGEINAELGGDYVTGLSNADAAQQATLAVLTVPYSAHRATLESVKAFLSGKILVDVTVPVEYPNLTTARVPEGKSAALEAQAILGETVKVVSAFQNVSSANLKDPNAPLNCDILVTGNETDAKKEVIRLVEAAGMRGFDAGSLANSVAAEALTPVLIYINQTYKAKGAGIRIVNVD